MLAVQGTGLPYILVDEALQKGKNFGEKYCNALEYCFNKGFEKLISIGTDCATITTEILLHADANSKDNNVIGADENGGFYLFALHKKNYSRKLFSTFSWCTTHLLKDISSYFKNNNLPQPTLIQKGKDINSIIDLIKVVRVQKACSFLKLLLQLFNNLNIEINFAPIKFNKSYLFTSSFRGPPSMVAYTF